MKNITDKVKVLGLADNRDILVKGRQQAAVCKAQGFPETHEFLTALCDEIERLRLRLAVVGAADAVALETAGKVNGHG